MGAARILLQRDNKNFNPILIRLEKGVRENLWLSALFLAKRMFEIQTRT